MIYVPCVLNSYRAQYILFCIPYVSQLSVLVSQCVTCYIGSREWLNIMSVSISKPFAGGISVQRFEICSKANAWTVTNKILIY